jgi:hypothetical protein
MKTQGLIDEELAQKASSLEGNALIFLLRKLSTALYHILDGQLWIQSIIYLPSQGGV